MHATPTRTAFAIGLAAAISLVGCSSMDRNTATGAAVGGVAGAVLTGSPEGAAVGAVLGGVVGNQVDKKKK